MTSTQTPSTPETGTETKAKPRRRMVSATRMRGSSVYNRTGERVGKIEDVVLDRRLGRVGYIVMASGGFLGFGEHLYAVPWDLVTYDRNRGAYFIPDEWLELGLTRAFNPSELAHWSIAAQARSAEIYQRV